VGVDPHRTEVELRGEQPDLVDPVAAGSASPPTARRESSDWSFTATACGSGRWMPTVTSSARREYYSVGGGFVLDEDQALREKLAATGDEADPLRAMEWVTLYALAASEENAAGGRVVTAPANGAPASCRLSCTTTGTSPARTPGRGWSASCWPPAPSGCCSRRTRPISGAEVGCQGEVGSACSMAAAGLAEHHVPLDKAIKTMRETGADMKDKYKETARGGLAPNIAEC
jgi:L-serine deaminase